MGTRSNSSTDSTRTSSTAIRSTQGRQRRAIAAAAFVVTALFGGVHTAEADAPFATGTVSPAPVGPAVATLYLWPDSEMRVNQQRGTKFSLQALAQAPVQGGSFVIPWPDDMSAAEHEALTNKGYANFMVSITSAESGGVKYFFRKVDRSGDAPALDIRMDLPPPSLQAAPTSASSGGRGGGIVLPVCGDGVCAPPLPSCEPEVIDLRNERTTIGEMHVPSYSNGHYSYSLGAETEIAVAIGDADGNWRTDGTSHQTKQYNTETGWNGGAGFAQQVQTYFQFEKFGIEGPGCSGHYKIEAKQWAGGAAYGVGVGQWDGQCVAKYAPWSVTFFAGTQLTKQSGAGFFYRIGATAFGVNLSAKSNWQPANSYVVNFGADHIMCGNDNVIPASSLVYRQ
jgi:hypothetical protein